MFEKEERHSSLAFLVVGNLSSFWNIKQFRTESVISWQFSLCLLKLTSSEKNIVELDEEIISVFFFKKKKVLGLQINSIQYLKQGDILLLVRCSYHKLLWNALQIIIDRVSMYCAVLEIHLSSFGAQLRICHLHTLVPRHAPLVLGS